MLLQTMITDAKCLLEVYHSVEELTEKEVCYLSHSKKRKKSHRKDCIRWKSTIPTKKE